MKNNDQELQEIKNQLMDICVKDVCSQTGVTAESLSFIKKMIDSHVINVQGKMASEQIERDEEYYMIVSDVFVYMLSQSITMALKYFTDGKESHITIQEEKERKLKTHFARILIKKSKEDDVLTQLYIDSFMVAVMNSIVKANNLNATVTSEN